MEPAPAREEFVSKLLLSDEAVLALGVRPSDVEQYRRLHYQNAFGIDAWYDRLSERTFRTVFVPISLDTARAILDTHRGRPADAAVLGPLEAALETAISGFPGGAFVKLATRSPKDVPIYDFGNAELRRRLDERLATVPEQLPELERQNLEVAAFVAASQEVLRVYNGRDALSLLLRSTRVAEDLSKAAHFVAQNPPLAVCVREWVPEVVAHPEGEFRCFVASNRLNAVTQYYSFCLFPIVVEKQDELKVALQAFFDAHLKEAFATHESYVFDVWVGFDASPLRILVVELNPFHIGAGTGLFSWRLDRHLFLHGVEGGGFELRIAQQVEENPYEVLPTRWKDYILKKREERETKCTCQ